MSDQARIVPVILSGGAGSRLWPMSRPEMPKQMLPLTSDHTMIQLTAKRTHDADQFAAPIIVSNALHGDIVEAQLRNVAVSPQAIILETIGRNTAPAIALAAIAAGSGDAPLLVMPSDHVIDDVAAFHDAITRALPLVRDGWLMTFGIDPHAPETGYGWIKSGAEIVSGVHQVAHFVEKPPIDRAEAMLAAGDHYWNGGIFLFRADAYLAALATFEPAMLAAAEQAMALAARNGNRIIPDPDAFAASPAESIDYAVMEKADRVAVVPVNMGWSDVGSWDALHALSDCDINGNACQGDVVTLDTTNSLVRTDGIRIAMVGMDNLIVVASGNDVLIVPRGRSQEVKQLLALMKND
ncbi:mannose-1-phosphate guanylyltransferase [Sphingomonas sp. 28-62-11]|uniref:mannose-1-phosphate guanylyltransferase/mannose-6-phosphate isomerase n=1 Tax=Sphingomonas sp. 28-62-11 TaxID=1970432 RepID=UPI000BCAFCE5|nr:MAG: mannose-1-phosphate guanylyltransferase/mannose-6-phosphate isomerase [Sphingomonas sp. 28-62-11]